MKPVNEIPVSNYHDDPFQIVRLEEVQAFVDSDCTCAEVKVKGTVSISREREQYKRAIRKIDHMFAIKIHQRNGHLYLKKALV